MSEQKLTNNMMLQEVGITYQVTRSLSVMANFCTKKMKFL